MMNDRITVTDVTDNEQEYTPSSLSALIDTWKEAVRGEADDDLIRVPVTDMRAMLAALAAHNELPALLARLDEVTAERDALAGVVESMREVMSPEYFKGRMMPASVSVHANARIHGMRLVVNAAPSSVLAARDAKVRAEALREAADLIENHWAPDSADGEEIVIGSVDLLRARADKEENR